MIHMHEAEKARLQSAVDHVWRHFITEQHPPGVDPNAAHQVWALLGDEPNPKSSLPCVFRAPSGDRCAIGILMPSDIDAPHLLAFDGGIGELLSDTVDVEGNVHDDLGLSTAEMEWLGRWAPLRGHLESLQSCHDLAVQDNRYRDGDDKWTVGLIVFQASLTERLTEYANQRSLTVPTN